MKMNCIFILIYLSYIFEIDRQTVFFRQKDGKLDGQLDGSVDRQMVLVGSVDRQIVGWFCRQIDSWMVLKIDRQLDGSVDRSKVGWFCRQIDSRMVLQIDRQLDGVESLQGEGHYTPNHTCKPGADPGGGGLCLNPPNFFEISLKTSPPPL